MRTDLTLRDPDGTERDVAVIAPPGTPLAAVPELLPGSAEAATGTVWWVGRRRLSDESVIGRPPLVDGAVIAPGALVPDDGWVGRVDVVGGPAAGQGIRAEGAVIAAGRAPGCEIVLPDARVSRRHAELDLRASTPTIRDLGSTHGTTVDGLPASVRPVPLGPGAIARVGDSFLAVAADPGVAAVTRPLRGGIGIHRTARLTRPPAVAVVELPTAPTTEPAARTPWLATMIPAVGAAILALVMRSAVFLAFAALSPITVLAAALGDRARRRRAHRHARAAHGRATVLAERQIADHLTIERRTRRSAGPDPAALARIAMRPGERVWERRRADDDLLMVRVGLADLPSALRVRRDGADSAAGELAAVPAMIDLASGPTGVVASPRARRALARWVVAQLATFVAPADLELVLLSDDEHRWHWLRWLPHIGARTATTAPERQALVQELTELMRARRADPGAWTGPRLVVLVDAQLSPTAAARLAPVLAAGAAVGITALCLGEHVGELPAQCVTVLRARSETEVTADLHGAGPTPVVVDQVSTAWAEQLARALAPLRDGHSGGAGLPDICRLADLPDWSPSGIGDRWRRSSGGADTVLGIGLDGPVTVDLDRDGPHLLVAGTTGSGKSELLQTLVTGLAARHPPEELNFLLIDYKGGAAFAQCADLPHTAGLVTDLDDQLTRRVLISLEAEIRRREALLGAGGAADFRHYRRTGAARLARLVLVVDEFATLAEEFEGFVPGLLAIAQRGRSLGLHLVLATQRPAGVVSPQIRANTALRIALRVTSPADSIDVIDGPQAATISRCTPGRAFIRLGTSTVAFQTARVAGPAAAAVDGVQVQPLDAWRRPVAGSPDAGSSAEASELARYVAAIRDSAAGSAPPARPWLPPLVPVALDVLPAGTHAWQVVVGRLDRPAAQRQDPLTVDLRTGSLLVAGSARSGRTTALLSLALAAAGRHSPRDLHLHAVGSGGGLAALRELPHLGTLAGLPRRAGLAARLIEHLHEHQDRRRGAGPEPRSLLLIDDWEATGAALDEHDGGRSTERLLALLRDASAAGVFVAITGGRNALNPRVAALITTRLVLRFNDPADYGQGGVSARAFPRDAVPGRGLRAGDDLEFQLAYPRPSAATAAADVAAAWPGGADDRGGSDGEQRPPLRLRALPDRVALADLPRRSEGWVLGLGGDHAVPIVVDLTAGARQVLIAGPPRSGRSTTVGTLWRQSGRRPAVVAAPSRSPLATAARELGVPCFGPQDDARELDGAQLLMVDDAELFTDTALADRLTDWIRADRPDRIALVAGRSDALAVLFRGPAAQVRLARTGILLHPGAVDGELLGIGLPRTRLRPVAGRGVLVPDPAWGIGDQPLPIQVAS